MNRALILYHSRTGTTAAFGGEIAAELSANGVRVTTLPLYKAGNESVEKADAVFVGCWTSGLFFFLQKHLPADARVSMIRLKSRNGKLNESNRQLINLLIHG